MKMQQTFLNFHPSTLGFGAIQSGGAQLSEASKAVGYASGARAAQRETQ